MSIRHNRRALEKQQQQAQQNRLSYQIARDDEARFALDYMRVMFELLMHFSDCRAFTEAVACRIDEALLLSPGMKRELVDKRLTELSAELAKAGTLLRDAMTGARFDPADIQEVVSVISDIQDTIQDYKAGQIPLHEARERISAERRINRAFSQFAQSLNYGGRPTGMTPGLRWLAERATIYKRENPRWPWWKIAEAIVNTELRPTKLRPENSLTPEQREALQALSLFFDANMRQITDQNGLGKYVSRQVKALKMSTKTG